MHVRETFSYFVAIIMFFIVCLFSRNFRFWTKSTKNDRFFMLRVVKWWKIDNLKIFFEILKVWVILSLLIAWIVFISKIHESMVIWNCNITFWRQIFGKTAFFLFFFALLTKIIKYQQMLSFVTNPTADL